MTAKWTPGMLRGAVAELRRSRTVAAALPAIERLVGFRVTSPALHAAMTARNLGQPSDYVGAEYDDGLNDVRALRRADETSAPARSSRRVAPPPAPPAQVDAVAPTDRPPPPFEPMPWHDVAPPPPAQPPSFSGVVARVVVPDSHGVYQDDAAVRAFLADLAHIKPAQIVMLGDHVDAGGIFSAHQPTYTEELDYSYEADCDATSKLLDAIQAAAPDAWTLYLAGNHETHVERAVSRMKANARDAKAMAALLAPDARLRLRERGIVYVKQDDFWGGLSVRGTVKLGHCFFTHGSRVNKHATASTLSDFGACVVHGHVHRMASTHGRTVASDAIGAWCPGTLAKLQPLYRHTAPTDWAHGYGLQFVEPDGRFLHVNIPILNGRSLLADMLAYFRPQRLMGAP